MKNWTYPSLYARKPDLFIKKRDLLWLMVKVLGKFPHGFENG
jgi:hypothetical protein